MIKLNGHIVEQGSFPDGTLMLKNLNECVAFGRPIEITWDYENDAELFVLICVRKYVEQFYPYQVTLQLPYCPHARQDRVKSSSDVFTLKYFCEVINSLNFSSSILLLSTKTSKTSFSSTLKLKNIFFKLLFFIPSSILGNKFKAVVFIYSIS